jgi:hypothetical protein
MTTNPELKTLVELTHKINVGDIQVGYNTKYNLQVLVIAVDNETKTENDYNVFFIKEDKVIKITVMGLTSKIGYYSARDIAEQGTELPIQLKL